MAILSKFGSAAARNFGMGSGKQLVVYTFPVGSSTWTAPAGVTLLVSGVGSGSDGTAGTWGASAYGQFGTYGETSTGSNGSVSWSTIYSAVVNNTNSINAGGSGERTVTWSESIWGIGTNGQLTRIYGGSYPGLTVRGTATILTWSGSPKTSGTVTYPGAYNNDIWATYVEALSGGSNGSATTGFGQSWPGGTSSVPTAPVTTINNITVTPGTTYTIQNNKSLVITYFQ